MRLLIIGGGGQLGREAGGLAPVHGYETFCVGRADVDITVKAAVDSAFERYRPDAVLNCAAWTKVDDAEQRREDAFRVNALGPELLAMACAQHDVLLCHVSTDYVFGPGFTSPIVETTVPNPCNVYGESKLAGEEAVRAFAPHSQIVRTSWLYGQDGPNFVLTMLRLAKTHDEVRVVGDQYGSPTWTGHLVPALLHLIERRTPGTFHLTNSGETTWRGFAEAVFEKANLSTRVVSISSEEYPCAAQRPLYTVLAHAAWADLGEQSLPSWQEGVLHYLATRDIHSNG